MNTPQTFFVFFYALYSAMAVTITGKLHPFDTPSMYKMYRRSWIRFFYSMLVLNVFPLMYFIYVYKFLSGYDDFQISFISVFLLFLLSLVGLGFYRIYYGSMLIQYKNSYFFYDKDLYSKTDGLPKSLHNDLRERPQSHHEPLPHIIPGVILVFTPLSLVYFFF